MSEVNDENQNTLNIAPLRYFRAAHDLNIKTTGKTTPKRSMKQLHKLLLIKDQTSLLEETQQMRCQCELHSMPFSRFCSSCFTFSLCEICAEKHIHPTREYSSIEECLQAEAQLLDRHLHFLSRKRDFVAERLINLQEISQKIVISKQNLFTRIRKFVDELEGAADLQINSILAAKRTEIIAYEKNLRRLTKGDPQFLREQLLTTELNSHSIQPNLEDVQDKCEMLLDKLRAFCYALRSPLIKQVNLSINLESSIRSESIFKQDTKWEQSEISQKPIESVIPHRIVANTSRTHAQSSASLQKCILKSIIEGQRRPQHNTSSFMKTLNLIGKQNANLSLESHKYKFKQGKAQFFG